MNEQKKEQHSIKLGLLLLVLIIIAVAWLVPSNIVMAASGSNDFKVSVEVVEAIGLDVGSPFMLERPSPVAGQIETKFVTRAASSSQSEKAQVSEPDRNTSDNVGLPLGSSGEVIDDVAPSGIYLIVTATSL